MHSWVIQWATLQWLVNWLAIPWALVWQLDAWLAVLVDSGVVVGCLVGSTVRGAGVSSLVGSNLVVDGDVGWLVDSCCPVITSAVDNAVVVGQLVANGLDEDDKAAGHVPSSDAWLGAWSETSNVHWKHCWMDAKSVLVRLARKSVFVNLRAFCNASFTLEQESTDTKEELNGM